MIETGWHANLPMSVYHGDLDTYSKTSISDFAGENITPYKFNYNRLNRVSKKSDAFDVGEATHKLLLEGGEAYRDHISIIPEAVLSKNGARSGKIYHEWTETQSDKLILKKNQADLVESMADSVTKNKTAMKYISGGMSEVTGVFKHHTGLHIKTRPDHIPNIPGELVLTDLKTNLPWGSKSFDNVAYDLKYHHSAYLSTLAAKEITGFEHSYIFVVVDKDPPNEVAILECPIDLLEIAEAELAPVIEELAECVKTGVWPGKPESVQTLGIPDFVKRRNFYR